MNNKAIAAIGTLALAAGIGLAACGGSGSSSTAPGPSAGHAPTTQPSRPVISPGNVPPFLTNGGPSENVEYTEADTGTPYKVTYKLLNWNDQVGATCSTDLAGTGVNGADPACATLTLKLTVTNDDPSAAVPVLDTDASWVSPENGSIPSHEHANSNNVAVSSYQPIPLNAPTDNGPLSNTSTISDGQTVTGTLTFIVPFEPGYLIFGLAVGDPGTFSYSGGKQIMLPAAGTGSNFGSEVELMPYDVLFTIVNPNLYARSGSADLLCKLAIVDGCLNN